MVECNLGSNLSTTKPYTNIHSGIVHNGQKGGGNGNTHQQTEDKQKNMANLGWGDGAQWVKALTTCELDDLSSAVRTHSEKEPTQQSCPLTPTCTP